MELWEQEVGTFKIGEMDSLEPSLPSLFIALEHAFEDRR